MPQRDEVGPVYGVPLLDTLPIGGMLQQLPSRQDLDDVKTLSVRTVAGYEVLLAHYVEARDALATIKEWRLIPADHLSRLQAMVEPGQQTWDLSDKDVAAIRAALRAIGVEVKP